MKPWGKFSSNHAASLGAEGAYTARISSRRLLCGGAAGALEDAADGACDIVALLEWGDVSLRVLVEVELATVPRDGAEDGFACGGHPWVVFADDEGAVAVAEQAFIPDPFRADVEDEVAALATSTS